MAEKCELTFRVLGLQTVA
uniref:Uncharacterized protein n=1 Tax=Anguilla anguilla TaxID=7936 RepID=A0A0E9TRE3_ANGAN